MIETFAIRETSEAGVARVSLIGQLDLAGKPELRDRVGDLLDDDAVTGVVIDLGELTFVDSTGIGALIGCLRLAEGTGKDLRVVGAQGRVAGVLDLTGVTEFLAGGEV